MASAVEEDTTKEANDGTPDTLEVCLSLMKEETNQEQFRVAVETLEKIFRNTVSQPGEEKFRRLKKTNKTFQDKVWKYDGAQQFMFAAGWIEVDDCVVLPSDVQLTSAVQVLEKECRLLSPPASTPVQSPEEVKKLETMERERHKREEAMRREREERKRIREQIKADRKDTSTRESKDSHAKQLSNGGQMTRFEDIGVDLTKGSG